VLLASGKFQPILKLSVISSLLKKPTLDKDQLSNYSSISNVSLISKIIECIVKSRLTDHLISNKLLNPDGCVRRSTSDVAVIVIKCAVGCCQVARHRRPTQSRPCTAVVDAPSVEPVDVTALRLLLPPMLLCFCFSCRCLILYL